MESPRKRLGSGARASPLADALRRGELGAPHDEARAALALVRPQRCNTSCLAEGRVVENQALLRTKLMPPVARRETVMRERLHVALSEGADRTLTLVAAGPGFGKSTLLAAWREAEAAHRSVAWLTLGESEHDP